jgi:hypothetical protein
LLAGDDNRFIEKDRLMFPVITRSRFSRDPGDPISARKKWVARMERAMTVLDVDG